MFLNSPSKSLRRVLASKIFLVKNILRFLFVHFNYLLLICRSYTEIKMKSQIKQIAKITSGIYLKGKPSGDVFNLQARDVDENFRFRKGLTPTAFSDLKVGKHYLHQGDVLVASKGNDFFAVVYNEEYFPAVASSIFLVIRNLDTHKVLPEYLSWFINHPKTQHYFKSVSKGTSLPTINKDHLASLEIPLPSVEKQKKIVLFDNLKSRRKKLITQICDLKEKLIDQQLLNTVNK